MITNLLLPIFYNFYPNIEEFENNVKKACNSGICAVSKQLCVIQINF